MKVNQLRVCYYDGFHSEMIETYPMMLLWYFSLGNDWNLPKLTH
jgi:hypothetical protein